MRKVEVNLNQGPISMLAIVQRAFKKIKSGVATIRPHAAVSQYVVREMTFAQCDVCV